MVPVQTYIHIVQFLCFFWLPLAIELLHTRNSSVVVCRSAYPITSEIFSYRALLQKRRMILRSHELVCRSAYPFPSDIFESSLKTRTSLWPRCRKKRPSSFELRAFERAFGNFTPSGVGCINKVCFVSRKIC